MSLVSVITFSRAERNPLLPHNNLASQTRKIRLRNVKHGLVAAVSNPELMQIAKRGLIGSIDLFSDNTDFLEITAWRPAVERLLRQGADSNLEHDDHNG